MIISLFKSTYAAYTAEEFMLDLSWDEIADMLVEVTIVPTKDKAEMFNLWLFDKNGLPGRKYHDKTRQTWDELPGTIRRCSENAIGVWGLVLDYDSGTTIEEAVTMLDGLTYVLYTSFRRTPELHKFRVVIPFSRMMLKQEFVDKMESIRETFPNVDPASFSESQAMYLHCTAVPEHAISFKAAGTMIDPDCFESRPEPKVNYTPTERTYDEVTPQWYTDAIFKSLMTCSNIRRGSAKNTGALLLAAICKASGIDFAGYEQIVMATKAHDSSLSDKQLREATWRDGGTANGRMTKQVRDNFILYNNGTLPVFEKPQESKELLRELFTPNKLIKELF